MSVGASIGGLASAVTSTLTGIGGTASVDDSALAFGIGGTTSVIETAAAPWLSREWGRVRVELDGEDITSLVGAVEWERSSEQATQYATFTLADARVAYAHASSLSTDSLPVRIYRYVESRSGSDEALVFQGKTVAPGNSEPILPTGTFRCISDSAIWDEPRACYRVGAFGAVTRADIIEELAASIGRPITMPPGSAVVQKPVELMNVSVFEILKRYGEIEGWYPRARVDGGLDVLAEGQVWDTGAAFWFDESNSFTPAEEPPRDIVTRWVLSGTRIASDFSGDATTGSGESIVEEVVGGIRDGKAWETKHTIKDSGSGTTYPASFDFHPITGQVVETTEEWDTFAPLGETVGTEAFRLKKRTSIYTLFKTYGLGGIGRTSQLDKRVTVVEEWFSKLAPKTGYLWTDSTHHEETAEVFRTTSMTTEEWLWFPSTDPDRPCELGTLTTTVEGYYAHANGGQTGQWSRDIAGTETYTEDTAIAFDDGDGYTYSTGGYGALAPISESVETWSRTSISGKVSVTQSIATSGYSLKRGETRGVYDAINNRQYRIGPLETYGALGTAINRWTQSAIEGKHNKMTLALDGSYSSTQEDGDVPDIPRSDGTTPAYQQETMVYDVEDLTTTAPYRQEVDTVIDAESMDELEAVWTRRKRLGRCVRHTIPCPDYQWLDVWEPVTETDGARSMTAWAGPVESLRVSVDVLSGFGTAEAVVLLEDPDA